MKGFAMNSPSRPPPRHTLTVANEHLAESRRLSAETRKTLEGVQKRQPNAEDELAGVLRIIRDGAAKLPGLSHARLGAALEELAGQIDVAQRSFEAQGLGVPRGVRPRWEDFVRTIIGIIPCACGANLHTHQQTREHWQLGHFDVVPPLEGAKPR